MPSGGNHDELASVASIAPQPGRAVAEAPAPATTDGAPADGQVTVLVVEDDDADRELVRRAFEECSRGVKLRFARDGEEALDYLFRFGKFSSEPEPPQLALILLDLNVPKLDGRKLLQEIREDRALRRTPVVVLTASDSEHDVLRSYENGANSYFTKPDRLDGYRKVIRVIESYWLRQAVLPPTARDRRPPRERD